LRVALRLGTSGIETYSAFIANRDSGEVHLRSCEWGRKIKRDNREYFCRLEDALAAGYNGCYYCLREYDTG
jgi:methylphosphotriester-DNA--protein-cysteine methyltransferase